jgi:hypothetical protein
MGLDMFLQKRSYVKNWEHMDKSELHTVMVKRGSKKRPDIKPERVSYVIEEVAYWRKFNALHGWFVNNLANGVDNCQEIYVSNENLKELHETLLKAQEILNNANVVETPQKDWNGSEYIVKTFDCENELNELGFAPTKGFFFGSQNISSYFKEAVDNTAIEIGNILAEIEENEKNGFSSDYYYQASW